MKIKKLTALILSALIAFSISAAAEESVKITNPGFEDGINNWRIIGVTLGDGVYLDSEETHGGSNSLKTVKGDANLIVYTAITEGFEAGSTYDFGMWTLCKDGGNISYKIEFYDKTTMNQGGLLEEQRVNITKSDSWILHNKNLKIPENCKLIAIYLCNYATNGTVAYFDDIYVSKNNAKQVPATENPSSGKTSENIIKSNFTDISGKPYEEAVNILSSVGIVTGKTENTFEPDSKFTRAEAVAIIIRLLGMEEQSTGRNIFTDVPSSHWAFKYISTAYDMNIVKGFSANTFEPESFVTYPQLIKMVVCALGYGSQAEVLGDYPVGYLSKASQIGILKGTSEEEGGLSRGMMAIIVENAINIPIMVRTQYGSSMKYEEKENATLLSEYLNIEKYEGRITASYDTIVTGARSVKRRQVAFENSIIFESGKTSAEDFVGRNVVIYAQIQDNKPYSTILYIGNSKNTKVLVLNAEDIIESQSTASRICYSENRKNVYANLAVNTISVYNGRPVSQVAFPEDGTITLISDYGTDYNVVLTEDYIDLLVKSTNADENMVYFKNAPEGYEELYIDANDNAVKTTFINSSGKAVTVNDCKKWNVISVAKSRDSKRLYAVLSDKQIKGKVKETGDGTAIIDSTEYTLSKSLIESTTLKSPEPGKEGAFYLNFRNKIAAANDEEELTKKYGFLIAAEMTKGIDSTPQFKVFASDGNINVYEAVEKINIKVGNDLPVTVPKSNIFDVKYGLANASGEITSQLIRYELNENKKIMSVEIAADSQNKNFNREEREVCFSLDENITSRTIFLGGNSRQLLTRYYIGDDCLIFKVPADISTGKDKDFQMISPNTIPHAQYFTSMKFYDVKSDNSVSALLVSDEIAQTVGDNGIAAIVKEISKGVNEDGDFCTLLKVITQKGEEVTLYGDGEIEVIFGSKAAIADASKETETVGGVVKAGIALNELNKGDVIQYEANGGKISAVAVRFRAKAPKVQEIIMSSGNPVVRYKDYNYTSIVMMYSKVLAKSDTAVRLEVPSTDGLTMWERSEAFKGAKIMLFDNEKETVKEITSDGIYEGDYIFTFRKTIYPTLVIVYR